MTAWLGRPGLGIRALAEEVLVIPSTPAHHATQNSVQTTLCNAYLGLDLRSPFLRMGSLTLPMVNRRRP